MEGKAIKLHVSYFGNAKKLREAGCAIVSIARFNPRYLSNLDGWCKSLAPRGEMLHMQPDEYERNMREILASADPHALFAKITACAIGRDSVAMCCYEKDWNQCHRKMVAEWFTKHGYACTEWAAEEPKSDCHRGRAESNAEKQGELF